MGGGVPLLNEYKQEFVWKRLPQTIFGGPKLKLGYSAPAYVYLTQVLLWSLPWLLGGIFTLVLELAYSSTQINDYLLLYCCLYGACITIFVVVVQTISTVVHIKEKENTKVITKKTFVADEDEIDFNSCCGAETIEFVIPPKTFKVNILMHGLVSGGMCGLTLWYLLPWTLNSLYGDNVGATAAVFVFGWFTLSIAQYSLTATAPPEPAIFRTMDVYEMSPMSRPFYVLVCLCFHLVHWNFEEFKTTNQTLHIVFACLPLLWLLGVLPPLESLLLWVGEQVHVFMLGGSPLASNLRLVLYLVVSVGVFLGAYYIPVCFGTVLLSVAMGYLLSTDLSLLFSQVLQACRSHNKVSTSQFLQDSKRFKANTGFGWSWGVGTFLYHLLMLLLATGLAAALNYYNKEVDKYYAGWVVVGLLVVEKVLRDVQSVYMVFGLLRNYFFPHACHHKNRPYIRSKLRLAVVGIMRRLLFNWVAPLTMVAYLSMSITQQDVMDQAATEGLSTVQAVWYTFGIVRAFRWAWQSTAHSLLEMSVVHIVVTVMSSNSTVRELGVPTLLLIAGLVRDRFFQLCNKLYFVCTLLLTSWMDKKQRRGSTAPTLFLSLVFFPLVFAIVAAAAVLSAPLLPIFTLPIFFIAFPRPQRFWPEKVGSSANVCADTVYYRQLAPVLAQSLRKGFAAGSLGEPHPGNHYLVRFQDRMIWVTVLERGNAYCTLSIKGLELQETSCHTAEAARMDEIFEMAFENERGVSCCDFTEYPLHSLTPVDVCELKTYSDARNVLTGIIDSPTAVETTLKFFVKSLVWLILQHVNKVKIREEAQKAQKEKEIRDEKMAMKKPLSSAVVTQVESKGRGKKVQSSSTKMEINHNNHLSNFNASAAFSTPMASNHPPPSLPPLKGTSTLVSLPPLTMDGRTKNGFGLPPLEDQRPPSAQAEKPRKASWSSSINSFSDSLWSDDDLEKPKSKKKSRKQAKVGHSASQPINPSITPVVPKFQQREKSDLDDSMDDLDFGLPMADVSRPKPNTGLRGGFSSGALHSSTRLNGNHIYKPVTNLAGSPDFKCQYSSHMSLPSKWRELPIEHSQLARHMAAFPVDWYRHVLSLLDWRATGLPGEKVAIDVGADDALTNCYSQLIMACYSAFDTPDKMSGPSYLYKTYMGDVPWNAMMDWLSEDTELSALVTKAFRLGFKLMLDSMLLGDIEEHEELEESLREFDNQWYIGLDGDAQWKAAVLDNRASLFSLGHNNVQGTYTSRTLTLQEVMGSVGRLNAEVVRGQWANLSLELLYMTNDDEERYSIQAHPTILRNLTVQSADPPLGYPIFSSEPISVPLL
ncbi:pecanex-like protein 4 [Babylonia areolata]|uniref:pecanex-like protein 4 n=1 Tax=Babylonia areolata TaxID=304850 RepID=UPI003FD3E7D9